MRIRVAQPDDAPGVVALRATVFPYLVRGVESTRKMIAEPPPEEDWTAFVAEVDDQVVGWVSAERIGNTSMANVGGIYLLHVHPEHRQRGIGSALLAAATDYLRPWESAGCVPRPNRRRCRSRAGTATSRAARCAIRRSI